MRLRAYRVAAVLCLALAPTFTRDAVADVATPLEITLLGPGAVRVRVTVGTTSPCDSGDNRKLVDGKFAAGQVLRATVMGSCVCVQQTFEPFSEVDWSQSSVACRPQICRGRQCLPARDPTIRLRLSSTRPH